MCGIFGWIVLNDDYVIDVEVGSSLTGMLNHRGPDATNFYHDDKTFLGHCRLKIIDLSDDANQPMSDDSNNYLLVFNGEIYNYIELKKELEKAGVLFRTSSDSEVLLRSFIQWGSDCLNKIEGMFAFAVYNRYDKSLFLARDHMGQKPLYYTFQKGQFIFSSELRSIINHPAVDKHIDLSKVFQYHVYDVFPFESTPLHNVKKLLPGHYMELNNGNVTIKQYWNSVPGQSRGLVSLDDALESLNDLLTDSVSKHLRSDVPFGVFLSGGVDSSLVTSYAKKVLKDKDLHTFSVQVNFSNFNESPIAKLVSNKLGCKAHYLPLNDDEIIDSMDEMFNNLDEPLADPGLINSFFIAKKAREFIKVALAGDGGDELFGGYITFKAVSWLERTKFLPDNLIPVMLMLSKMLVFNKNSYMNPYFKLKQFVKGKEANSFNRLPKWLAAFSIEEINQLYNSDFLFHDKEEKSLSEESLFSDLYRASTGLQGMDLTNIMLYQYQKYFLPEFVLAHTDRASMQTSLEVRCPLIDKSIVEFANDLPLKLKIKNGKLKRILFELLKMLEFPADVITHKKQGFTFPVASWLTNRLKSRMMNLLNPDKIRSEKIFNESYIAGLIDDHLSLKENNYRALWNLMVFFQWKENFPNLSFK